MNGCMNTLTLQKMRYLVTIAEQGSFTRAAGVLFVSQPSLTKSIREIEEELGFPVFERTRKGVRVTRQGEEFLAYVRQILDQADLLQEKYMNQGPRKKQYCISAHHYSFAERAFIELVRSHQDDEFDFSFRETQTSEIVDDVAGMRSALGVMCLNNFNEPVLRRIFKERDLLFEEIAQVQPHVLVSVHHPLSGRRSLELDELAEYPHVSFEQGEHNSFYYAEELFNPAGHPRSIRVRDRATLFDLLLGGGCLYHQQWRLAPGAYRYPNHLHSPGRAGWRAYRHHSPPQSPARQAQPLLYRTTEKEPAGIT